ncbi:MAG: hypothetical protein ABI685_04830 [Ferruginibacter sp.]
MIKQLFIASIVYFLLLPQCFAQKTGILPLTGIHYYNEGLWSNSIAVKISGEQLFGNRIPLSREIEITLQQPTGFIADKKKIVFIGAEYSLVSLKGEVLRTIPNLLFQNETKGFTVKDLKLVSLKFGIAEGVIQPNSKAVIKIRLFDLKGKNQLRLEYPVSISYPKETIPITKAVQTLKTPAGSMFMMTEMKAKSLAFSVDTTLTQEKNMAYIKLDISKVDGTDIVGMLQGKETFWVYDNAHNEVKIKEKLLKKVGGAMEGGSVNCTINIPFRLKADKTKGYMVRYRWESVDKLQVMDIVVTQ